MTEIRTRFAMLPNTCCLAITATHCLRPMFTILFTARLLPVKSATRKITGIAPIVMSAKACSRNPLISSRLDGTRYRISAPPKSSFFDTFLSLKEPTMTGESRLRTSRPRRLSNTRHPIIFSGGRTAPKFRPDKHVTTLATILPIHRPDGSFAKATSSNFRRLTRGWQIKLWFFQTDLPRGKDRLHLGFNQTCTTVSLISSTIIELAPPLFAAANSNCNNVT